jgi:protein tyrosine/serine phosphatase
MVFRRPKSLFLASCLTLGSLVVAAVGFQEARWALSFRHEKLSLPGVGNFGRVNPRLYRGAQPTAEGFAELRKLGVDTVVRLSMGDDAVVESQRAMVEPLGMQFVNLPWSTMHEPRTEQVAEFLTLVRRHPDRTFFVHCKAGVDRTGTFVALYRIVLDHWAPTHAMDEMKAFRYRWLFLPHLQAYVETFPSKLTSEPAFVDLATAAVPTDIDAP